MSVLAGFDLVIELAPSAILGLVRDRPPLVDWQPPLDLPPRSLAELGGGDAHLIIARRALGVGKTSSGEPAITAVFFFDRLSIFGNETIRAMNGGRDVFGRSGYVRLVLPLAVEPETGPRADSRKRELVVRLSAATATARFDDDGNDLPAVRDAIARGVQQSITRPYPSEPMRAAAPVRISLPVAIAEEPEWGVSPLRVRDLTLASFPPAGTTDVTPPQSLALFASMRRDSAGNLADRSGPDPALLRGSDPFRPSPYPASRGSNVLVGISPTAFRKYVLIPALQQALGLRSPGQLPPPLGEGELATLPEQPRVSITRIEPIFEIFGLRLRIEGHYRDPDGPNPDVAFGIEGWLTIGSNGRGEIVPGWTTISGSATPTFGVGMWIAGLFFPLLMLGLQSFTIVGTLLSGARISELTDPIRRALRSVTVPTLLPNVYWTAASLTQTGGILTGETPVELTPPVRPRVDLAVNTAPLKRSERRTGTFVSTGCPEGEYSWTIYSNQESVTIEPRPHFAGRPVTYQWHVSAIDPGATLTRETAQPLNVTALCAVPDPPGSVVDVRGDVAIAWRLQKGGAALVLTTSPEYGNFSINVDCTMTDVGGVAVTERVNVRFVGQQLEMHDGWNEAIRECISVARGQVDERAILGTLPYGLRVGGVSDPPPLGSLPGVIHDISDIVAAVLVATQQPKLATGILTPLLLSHTPEQLLDAVIRSAITTVDPLQYLNSLTSKEGSIPP